MNHSLGMFPLARPIRPDEQVALQRLRQADLERLLAIDAAAGPGHCPCPRGQLRPYAR